MTSSIYSSTGTENFPYSGQDQNEQLKCRRYVVSELGNKSVENILIDKIYRTNSQDVVLYGDKNSFIQAPYVTILDYSLFVGHDLNLITAIDNVITLQLEYSNNFKSLTNTEQNQVLDTILSNNSYLTSISNYLSSFYKDIFYSIKENNNLSKNVKFVLRVFHPIITYSLLDEDSYILKPKTIFGDFGSPIAETLDVELADKLYSIMNSVIDRMTGRGIKIWKFSPPISSLRVQIGEEFYTVYDKISKGNFTNPSNIEYDIFFNIDYVPQEDCQEPQAETAPPQPTPITAEEATVPIDATSISPIEDEEVVSQTTPNGSLDCPTDEQVELEIDTLRKKAILSYETLISEAESFTFTDSVSELYNNIKPSLVNIDKENLLDSIFSKTIGEDTTLSKLIQAQDNLNQIILQITNDSIPSSTDLDKNRLETLYNHIQNIIDIHRQYLSLINHKDNCENPEVNDKLIEPEPVEPTEKPEVPQEEVEVDAGPCEIFPNKGNDDWGIKFTYKESPNISGLLRASCEGTAGSFYDDTGENDDIEEEVLLNNQEEGGEGSEDRQALAEATINTIEEREQRIAEEGSAVSGPSTPELSSSSGGYSSGGELHEWEMTLLPAMRSVVPKSPGMDVPNVMPGLQFQIRSNIAKHRVPGGQAIYQNLGVDSVMVTIVGCFTGDGGYATEASLAGRGESVTTASPILSEGDNPFINLSRELSDDEKTQLENFPLEIDPQNALNTFNSSNVTDMNFNGLSSISTSSMKPTGRGGRIWELDGCPCDPDMGNSYLSNSDQPYIVGSGSKVIPQYFNGPDWNQRPTMFTLYEQLRRLDSYHEFTSFYKMAIEQGRELEIEINLDKYSNGLESQKNLYKKYGLDSTSSVKHMDSDWGPLRNGANGNPRFKGLIKAMEVYHSKGDRTWYLMQVELTDLGLTTDIPLNLTKIVQEASDQAIQEAGSEDDSGFTTESNRLLDCLLMEHPEYSVDQFNDVPNRAYYRSSTSDSNKNNRMVWSTTTGQGMLYTVEKVKVAKQEIKYAKAIGSKTLLEPREMIGALIEGGRSSRWKLSDIRSFKKYLHLLNTGAIYAIPNSAAGNCGNQAPRPREEGNELEVALGPSEAVGDNTLRYGNIQSIPWLSELLEGVDSKDPNHLGYWKPKQWKTEELGGGESENVTKLFSSLNEIYNDEDLTDSNIDTAWFMGYRLKLIKTGPLQGYGLIRRSNNAFTILNPAQVILNITEGEGTGNWKNFNVEGDLEKVISNVCLRRNPNGILDRMSTGYGSDDPQLIKEQAESCMTFFTQGDIANWQSSSIDTGDPYRIGDGELIRRLVAKALLSCGSLVVDVVGGLFLSVAAGLLTGGVLAFIGAVFTLFTAVVALIDCLKASWDIIQYLRLEDKSRISVPSNQELQLDILFALIPFVPQLGAFKTFVNAARGAFQKIKTVAQAFEKIPILGSVIGVVKKMYKALVDYVKPSPGTEALLNRISDFLEDVRLKMGKKPAPSTPGTPGSSTPGTPGSSTPGTPGSGSTPGIPSLKSVDDFIDEIPTNIRQSIGENNLQSFFNDLANKFGIPSNATPGITIDGDLLYSWRDAAGVRHELTLFPSAESGKVRIKYGRGPDIGQVKTVSDGVYNVDDIDNIITNPPPNTTPPGTTSPPVNKISVQDFKNQVTLPPQVVGSINANQLTSDQFIGTLINKFNIPQDANFSTLPDGSIIAGWEVNGVTKNFKLSPAKDGNLKIEYLAPDGTNKSMELNPAELDYLDVDTNTLIYPSSPLPPPSSPLPPSPLPDVPRHSGNGLEILKPNGVDTLAPVKGNIINGLKFPETGTIRNVTTPDQLKSSIGLQNFDNSLETRVMEWTDAMGVDRTVAVVGYEDGTVILAEVTLDASGEIASVGKKVGSYNADFNDLTDFFNIPNYGGNLNIANVPPHPNRTGVQIQRPTIQKAIDGLGINAGATVNPIVHTDGAGIPYQGYEFTWTDANNITRKVEIAESSSTTRMLVKDPITGVWSQQPHDNLFVPIQASDGTNPNNIVSSGDIIHNQPEMSREIAAEFNLQQGGGATDLVITPQSFSWKDKDGIPRTVSIYNGDDPTAGLLQYRLKIDEGPNAGTTYLIDRRAGGSVVATRPDGSTNNLTLDDYRAEINQVPSTTQTTTSPPNSSPGSTPNPNPPNPNPPQTPLTTQTPASNAYYDVDQSQLVNLIPDQAVRNNVVQGMNIPSNATPQYSANGNSIDYTWIDGDTTHLARVIKNPDGTYSVSRNIVNSTASVGYTVDNVTEQTDLTNQLLSSNNTGLSSSLPGSQNPPGTSPSNTPSNTPSTQGTTIPNNTPSNTQQTGPANSITAGQNSRPNGNSVTKDSLPDNVQSQIPDGAEIIETPQGDIVWKKDNPDGTVTWTKVDPNNPNPTPGSTTPNNNGSTLNPQNNPPNTSGTTIPSQTPNTNIRQASSLTPQEEADLINRIPDLISDNDSLIFYDDPVDTIQQLDDGRMIIITQKISLASGPIDPLAPANAEFIHGEFFLAADGTVLTRNFIFTLKDGTRKTRGS